MKAQLVVADLDGSLVIMGQPISRNNVKAIDYLHSKGIKFGIATGRNLFDIMRLPRRWKLDFDFDFYIGMNGSEVYDTATGVRIDSYKLAPEDLKDIIMKMKPLGLNPFILYKDGMMMKHEDAGAKSSSKRNEFRIYIAHDDSEMWQEENAKIMFRVEEEKCDEIFKYAKSISNDRYKAVRTQKTMIEFVHPLIDKAKGLINYCEMYDIPLDEVIAFGDTTNDNEMLECCYGVCLENGTDDTKAIAREVTDKPCEEDGFADWIFKNID